MRRHIVNPYLWRLFLRRQPVWGGLEANEEKALAWLALFSDEELLLMNGVGRKSVAAIRTATNLSASEIARRIGASG